ncbi:MAG: hypothetical protein RMK29_06845 [Myxococcales bacterium]|nr:hypothetical protein [Myxococcota bacterium]MDW8281410.1 hypothetical protein [Myxococcales bacterium]
MRGSKAAAVRQPALACDPISADDILAGFYRPRAPVADRPPDPISVPARTGLPGSPLQGKKQKPSHYKIVCISLYTEDIQRLNAIVAELKRRGHTKANKSQVIRAALEQIDLDKVPRIH